MAAKKHLVKRHGHTEPYDERKVYASVYSAALNSHMNEKPSEALAAKVSKKVSAKVRKGKDVSSHQIRDWIVEELGGLDNDVAFLYVHHLDIN